jgi:hypothetical protein
MNPIILASTTSESRLEPIILRRGLSYRQALIALLYQ